MAIYSCKMCGGKLAILAGQTVTECEYCGSMQTVPSADNEKKMSLFSRANRLRVACEFDKASGLYEGIVADFPEEAEAYWGLILCKYGIEYIDDPATGKRIPTCHRSSFHSVTDDLNFKLAQEKADSVARKVYIEEAQQLEEIRKGIISVSASEEPYDIFICYKETGEDGSRTLDSVLAQDIYDALTEKGYRTFFSRITLEDKLGQEYEPYIFSALNSAKIMLVVGTDYEHFDAVWVKNEWSRYLKLMEQDKSKHLIPCYKGIDAYDMPNEFSKLQAQDLGKIGAMQDLLRGIGKLIPIKETNTIVIQNTVSSDPGQIESLLKNARIHVTESNWENAKEACDRITAINPSNAWAYIYQLARVMRINDPEKLGECTEILSNNTYFQKALKYAEPALVEKLKDWCRSSEESYERAAKACAPGMAKARLVKPLLSGGREHIAAVLTDGTVTAMGSNEKGQCNVHLWRDIVAVACGAYFTVGLRSDGTVVACGDNEFGQCNVESWKNIVAIACHGNHTVGLRKDGTATACGKDVSGKLEVNQWQNIRGVSCGLHTTAALKNDGTVIACGSNKHGQCDTETWTNIEAICSSNIHTVGLKRNGRVLACGNNESGQCKVTNWQNIVDVATGTHHTVGLRNDGTLIACGDDGSGRCSDTLHWNRIVGVVKSYWRTLAIREDGTVLVCGYHSDNFKVTNLKLFQSIDTLEEERIAARKARQIQDARDQEAFSEAFIHSIHAQTHLAAGQEHIVRLALDGKVFACGSNEKGQCKVSNWRRIKKIACGEFTTLAVCENGTVVACGSNADGQCEVKAWENITDVVCGYKHSVGLRSDGTVVACGNNEYGQCEVKNWTNVVAIACGFYHTVGLCADGTVLSCGSNSQGQCNTKEWKNVVAICSNNLHTVGLLQGGRVVACGGNEDGRCNVNDWQDIVSISCGSHHTLGLKTNGTVVACGHDGTIRCSGTTSWNQIVGIVCGKWFSLGIRNDGTIVACGEMENGKKDIQNWKLFNSIFTYERELSRSINYAKNLAVCHRNWGSQIAGASQLVIDDHGKVQCNSGLLKAASNWKDIVSVAGTKKFAVGLRKDGTVIYCGKPADGSENVIYWEEIVQIACHENDYGKNLHIVGLRQDGTVVACGNNKYGQCNVSGWTNISRIYCSEKTTIGLRNDGTVVLACDSRERQQIVKHWQNITDISCCDDIIVGLRNDGTVIAISSYWQEKLDKWNNIIQIATGCHNIVGLRSDGTVLVYDDEHCNVENWKDIISVACGYAHIIGIHESGNILVAGRKDEWWENKQNLLRQNALLVKYDNRFSYPDILCHDGTINGYWKVYDEPYEALRPRKTEIPSNPVEKAKIHQQVQERIQWRKFGVCQHCGGKFKGAFTKKCSLCEIEKDY